MRRDLVGPWALGYVLAVSALALIGFVSDVFAPIGLAALLTLPASLATIPAFYLTYGLLALVPGANPDTASGSGGSDLATITTGEPAAWFTVVTGGAGVLAIAVAAVIDVMLVGTVRRRRARRPGIDRGLSA